MHARTYTHNTHKNILPGVHGTSPRKPVKPFLYFLLALRCLTEDNTDSQFSISSWMVRVCVCVPTTSVFLKLQTRCHKPSNRCQPSKPLKIWTLHVSAIFNSDKSRSMRTTKEFQKSIEIVVRTSRPSCQVFMAKETKDNVLLLLLFSNPWPSWEECVRTDSQTLSRIYKVFQGTGFIDLASN